MKKRFGALMLALVLAFSLAIPAGAAEVAKPMESDAASEHLIYDDGRVSEATIADVDVLTQERTQAVFNGDEETAEEILMQLQEMGGRPSTQEEIDLFAKSNTPVDEANIAAASADTAVPASVTNYMTYTYTSTVNGKTYNVKRVDSVASTSSNLYHKGVVAKKTSANKTAAAFGVCKAVGAAVAGAASTTASNALSVYSAVSGTIASISPTTVIKDIDATYTYQIQEYCSFYSYKNANGSWVPFAVGSYADMTVTAVVLKVTPSGGVTSSLDNCTSTYKNKLYAANSNPNNKSNNTANLLKSYLSTYLYNNSSRVLSATIYSDGTNVVRRIGLIAPTSTGEIN